MSEREFAKGGYIPRPTVTAKARKVEDRPEYWKPFMSAWAPDHITPMGARVITEAAVEAAAKSQSERIRPGTWDVEPESYRNWWRDEARLNLHLEEIIGARLETSIERYLARPILTNQEEAG